MKKKVILLSFLALVVWANKPSAANAMLPLAGKIATMPVTKSVSAWDHTIKLSNYLLLKGELDKAFNEAGLAIKDGVIATLATIALCYGIKGLAFAMFKLGVSATIINAPIIRLLPINYLYGLSNNVCDFVGGIGSNVASITGNILGTVGEKWNDFTGQLSYIWGSFRNQPRLDEIATLAKNCRSVWGRLKLNMTPEQCLAQIQEIAAK